ncbi:hypothetical protein JCM33374_g6425 [Metschnikowia sp. JCM 33374]|nr:hypothetical protein JCM33374_g6425 [Metschnikowia sp. JCM 33374]
METPPTPAHVQPDEEVDIPSGTISLDLDLNPGLEDDNDNSANPFTGNTPRETPLNTPFNTRNETPLSMASNGADGMETAGQDAQSQGPSAQRGVSPPQLVSRDISISSWTLPFEESFELLQRQFNEGAKHEPITLAQQSKFINYVDGELLQIQRKFIKNQSESQVTYSLGQLIGDLSPVIDLLWFSISDHECLFGQEEYYVKILGDLDDWISYYSFPSLATRSTADIAFHVKFFDFFQRLDTQVSFLMDGYDASCHFWKMSPTEVIRLSPIVMRLRLTIISRLEHSRETLSAARNVSANDQALNILDVEIGRLLEGILERI